MMRNNKDDTVYRRGEGGLKGFESEWQCQRCKFQNTSGGKRTTLSCVCGACVCLCMFVLRVCARVEATEWEISRGIDTYSHFRLCMHALQRTKDRRSERGGRRRSHAHEDQNTMRAHPFALAEDKREELIKYTQRNKMNYT